MCSLSYNNYYISVVAVYGARCVATCWWNRLHLIFTRRHIRKCECCKGCVAVMHNNATAEHKGDTVAAVLTMPVSHGDKQKQSKVPKLINKLLISSRAKQRSRLGGVFLRAQRNFAPPVLNFYDSNSQFLQSRTDWELMRRCFFSLSLTCSNFALSTDDAADGVWRSAPVGSGVHLWVVLFRWEGREEKAAVAQDFSETTHHVSVNIRSQP